MRGLIPGSRRPATAAARASGSSPELGVEYLDWLDEVWQGDTRELREGRYLHQQGELGQAFEGSDYWREVATRLDDWAHAYTKKTAAPLFHGAPHLPKLAYKPWRSFLSRTWRENVSRNENWPEPPPNGWWLPDNWFERAWDIVRTRIVVRYMDGVETVAKGLVVCAKERHFGLEASFRPEAKADGYYAYHVLVRQPFTVAAVDYDVKLNRYSTVEIQVMTELADLISDLTHAYYERTRESWSEGTPWQWDPLAEETMAFELSQDSSKVERQIMRLREKLRAQAAKRAPGRQRPHRRIGGK